MDNGYNGGSIIINNSNISGIVSSSGGVDSLVRQEAEIGGDLLQTETQNRLMELKHEKIQMHYVQLYL